MKHFAKLMLLTLGIGVVAVVVSSFPRHTAAAASDPSLPVKVTNTPLPVTGSVNAAVTGTVNANITNTPSVNVSSLPAVQLAAGTTVGVTGGTFSLANTSATPIFTRGVDNPANQPFAQTLCFSSASGGCNAAPGSFTVPTVIGATSAPVQRLVIEYYSAQCQFSNAADGGLNLEVITAGSDNFYYIGPLSLDTSVPGVSQPNPYKYNQQARIYADPGTNVYLNTGSGVGPGSITCAVTVSGYLSLK
jgi:hypothetical protein